MQANYHSHTFTTRHTALFSLHSRQMKWTSSTDLQGKKTQAFPILVISEGEEWTATPLPLRYLNVWAAHSLALDPGGPPWDGNGEDNQVPLLCEGTTAQHLWFGIFEEALSSFVSRPNASMCPQPWTLLQRRQNCAWQPQCPSLKNLFHKSAQCT